MKKCITHHKACDCLEAFEHILNAVDNRQHDSRADIANEVLETVGIFAEWRNSYPLAIRVTQRKEKNNAER
jgi:hypothetical protein